MPLKKSSETQKLLNSVPEIIKKTFPIPGRFRSSLPSRIAELSRLLTNGRGERSLSYLSRPELLSAYLYYFLPWNLCRLCILLPGLDLNLAAGDRIVDLGSGPLTLASALWISRPDLHNIPLEITCIDRSAPALEAGKKFFAAIGGSGNWKINPVKEGVDFRKTGVTRNQKPAALVCAINLFNEVYENLPHNLNRGFDAKGLQQMAANSARIMHGFASPSASILTLEPGVPQSGRFISFLRNAFLELERPPKSPCPHNGDCPLSGAKKKWCHFSYDASNLWFGSAPEELKALSKAAGIPKERLVFSYLFTGSVSGNQAKSDSEKVRVISDAFPLPSDKSHAVKQGRYGCSAKGLVLLTGERSRIEKIASGDLAAAGKDVRFLADNEIDAKSGAIIAEVL